MACWVISIFFTIFRMVAPYRVPYLPVTPTFFVCRAYTPPSPRTPRERQSWRLRLACMRIIGPRKSNTAPWTPSNTRRSTRAQIRTISCETARAEAEKDAPHERMPQNAHPEPLALVQSIIRNSSTKKFACQSHCLTLERSALTLTWQESSDCVTSLFTDASAF